MHGILLLETRVARLGGGGQGRLSRGTLESGFERPVPVSKTGKGEKRELRLPDTKAHTPNCRLYGLQRPVLTESISRKEFTKRCSAPKAPALNSTKTGLHKWQGGRAGGKAETVARGETEATSGELECRTDPGQQGVVQGSLRN